MISSVTARRASSLLVAGALVFTPFTIRPVSAATSVKDGDKCAKVGLKTRGSSGVTLTCTRIGTTKVLKWKRVVTKPTATTTTTQPAVTTASQISIYDFSFSVASNVKSTSSIKVSNLDGSTHTVTSDNGAFDVTVAGGATASLPSLNPGTYTFHCKIHVYMSGTLIVG